MISDMDAILNHIDEDTALSVRELSDRLDCTPREVQRGLEELMEQGEITSTPDFKYRRSRRIRSPQ